MSQKKTIQQSDTEFICKLCDMIQKNPQIINWNKQGDKMIIFDIDEMEKLILPQYFRHSNFSSFIRQLNMYDFHKLYKENKSIAFLNQFFKRGNEKNFHFIQRRKKIKKQYRVSVEFEKKNQSILKRLKKQPKIDQSLKQSIQSLMEFKYTAYENLKKIRKGIESLENQVKQCRSKKIFQSINDIKEDLLQELKQQLKMSKQIDILLEKQFLSQKENKPAIENQLSHKNSDFYSPFTSSDKLLGRDLIDCRNLTSNHQSFIGFSEPHGYWSVNDAHSIHQLFSSIPQIMSEMYANVNDKGINAAHKSENDDDQMSMEMIGEEQLQAILDVQPNIEVERHLQKDSIVSLKSLDK